LQYRTSWGEGGNVKAIILAGGKGVRLYPITQVIPKPLVPIREMPILEIVIRQLKKQGIERITLAVGYMANLIRAYFGDGSNYGVKIEYSFEDLPLGTAGPLAQIPGLDETFLMMNADVLTDLDYRELVDFHRSQGGIATIGAYERQVQMDLGVIVADGNYRITDYVEKPTTSHLVSIGIYVFEPRVLSYIKKDSYLDFPDLVKLLIQDGQQVNYYRFSGYWLDIGRHDDYAKAIEEYDNAFFEAI
jgi:NDP-mannose synthase